MSEDIQHVQTRLNILVSVLDTVIQVADGIEGHIGKVLLMNVVGKARAELNSELALHVRQLLSSNWERYGLA